MNATALFVCALIAGGAAALAWSRKRRRERPVELATPTGSLKGTLMLPAGASAAKMPVALLIAGSGPTDRDGNSPMAPAVATLRRLAIALAQQGIASVRYDKRAIGASCSTPESDLRFETYVDDAVMWLKMLRADARFGDVLVAGHSEGALIALLAAQQVRVAGVVCIEGTALRASDLLRRQLDAALPPELRDINETILERLESGGDYPFPPAALMALYRPSVQPYLASWFRHWPTREIASIDVPVLIVHGGNDVQVEADAGAALLQAHPGARLLQVEGMDHLLLVARSDPPHCDSRSGPDQIARALSTLARPTSTPEHAADRGSGPVTSERFQ